VPPRWAADRAGTGRTVKDCMWVRMRGHAWCVLWDVSEVRDVFPLSRHTDVTVT